MKYMGSKSRIAKYIVPILQECIDSNHVTTYIEPFVGGGNVIDKIRCQERIGSDINPYLIALLKRVQEGKPLLDEVSRDTYNLVRDAWKNGTDKDKYQEGKRNLEKQASDLFNITLKCNEYKEYAPQHYKGCVFYLDPPYLNTNSYGINPTFDHEVFWSWARELSKNNYVYISELVAPKDFEIVWNRSTLVSIDAHNTKTRNECLFKWKG